VGRFQLSESPLDASALQAGLRDPRAGACASFEGWVRDHNDGLPVTGLRYEAYPELAAREGEAILAEALARFDIVDAACAHRIGTLAIGEMAVWVGASAGHRGPAFEACRWIIDQVKARVPIWKHERYAGGQAGWLHPADGDSAGPGG
jgi:molybdopterin synthase catalytic subunit